MANNVGLRRHRAKAAPAGSARAAKRLRPRNKQLLHWLDSWLATPDDRGESWWNKFEADLSRDRLTIQYPRMG